MDLNKDWVDYKRFDPNPTFQFVADNYSGNFNYTFLIDGLYLFGHLGHNCTINNFTTNATNRIDLVFNSTVTNGNPTTVMLLNAKAGESFTCNYAIGSYGTSTVLFYLGNTVSQGSMLTRIQNVQDGTVRYDVNNVSNRVILAMGSASGTQSITVTTKVKDRYIITTRFACISTLRETGNISIVNTMVTGGAPMIMDIQIE